MGRLSPLTQGVPASGPPGAHTGQGRFPGSAPALLTQNLGGKGPGLSL